MDHVHRRTSVAAPADGRSLVALDVDGNAVADCAPGERVIAAG
jgi:hypothetical protein